MIENGNETEVELVLFRLPEMSDGDFARDAMMVKKDLNSLKLLLQQSA